MHLFHFALLHKQLSSYVISVCTVAPAPAPARPFDALQDSQLFDAETSEPPSACGEDSSSSQDWPPNNRKSEGRAVPASPRRWQSSSSGGSKQQHRARGTEAAVLYGVMSDAP